MADTETTIPPALTPEQWANLRALPNGARLALYAEFTEGRQPDMAMVAALALYGQPFGFTQEMVSALRDAAELLRSRLKHFTGYADEGSRLRNRAMWCDAIADRLAALLPPK